VVVAVAVTVARAKSVTGSAAEAEAGTGARVEIGFRMDPCEAPKTKDEIDVRNECRCL
jgi:hypothetical protein